MISPFSAKWTPFFHNSILGKLKLHRKQALLRIRNITNGRTMPEIISVPIGSAKKMEAAILFFDLQDFTSATSKLTNEATLYILSAIIPQMMYVVKHWKGEVEKNTGDGIMAIFGTETRDNFLIARDVIEASMAMRYVMINDIHPKLLAENLPLLHFRIGIDMQEVLISRIGVKETNFLTVVGDAANRASKLQEFAETDGICIGENIYNNLHPLLHGNCIEGSHKDWTWHYPDSKRPYRFFHFGTNYSKPEEWLKIVLNLKKQLSGR